MKHYTCGSCGREGPLFQEPGDDGLHICPSCDKPMCPQCMHVLIEEGDATILCDSCYDRFSRAIEMDRQFIARHEDLGGKEDAIADQDAGGLCPQDDENEEDW